MLQVGGVQEPIIDAPPGFTPLTVPSDTVATAVSEELHVKGTPLISVFAESVTVAVMVFEPPVAILNEVSAGGAPFTCRVMDFTRQVSNVSGELVTVLILANKVVLPGVLAVASI
jgi:hypothetical protein